MRSDKYIMSPNLRKNEAYIWTCNPDNITDVIRLKAFEQLLSEEETSQYQRFHNASDQHRYLVSHALVRTVLSKYANCAPDQWSFKKNKHGRPEINQTIDATPLKFNLTHTQGFSACVVTLGIECGIDAEMLARDNDLEKIATKMFTNAELAILSMIKGVAYKNMFFKLWTLRESYVKALGTGLAASSKNFSFSIDAATAFINYVNEENNVANHWQFSVFEPTSKHIAAVALQTKTAEKLTIINQIWEFD